MSRNIVSEYFQKKFGAGLCNASMSELMSTNNTHAEVYAKASEHGKKTIDFLEDFYTKNKHLLGI